MATVALHWAGLRGAVEMLRAESPGRRAVAGPSPIRLVAREALRRGDSVPEESTVRSPPSPSAEALVRQRVPPVAAAGSGPSRTGVANAPLDDDDAREAYRFFGAKEVDVTAEPVSQWNLDPTALDALATSRIVFTLFVGRDGSVLHCSVDEPERLRPEQRKALEARLAGTEMRPARRAGEAVPSRRRVELFTVGGA